MRWWLLLLVLDKSASNPSVVFTKPDAPGTVFLRFKGKAHECRYLLPILLEVLTDPLTQVEDPRFPGYVNHRMSCLTYLCRFYGMCDAPTPFLTPDRGQQGGRELHESISAFL